MQDGYDQTLSGLLRKRAELAGEVERHRTAWQDAGAALNAIDAAILVFDPAIRPSELPASKRAPTVTAGTSPIQRFLLDHMRRTGAPLRTLEASHLIMADRGIDARNRVMATAVRKAVGDAFSRLRKAGHIASTKYGSGSELEWRLSPAVANQ